MIIKVFKISTKEMFTFKNKSEFLIFVYNIVGPIPADTTINNLMQLLPKNDYCSVKGTKKGASYERKT